MSSFPAYTRWYAGHLVTGEDGGRAPTPERSEPHPWRNVTKLSLVASGLGVTTAPPYLAALVPQGVRLVRVVDGAPWSVAPHGPVGRPLGEPVAQVAEQLRQVVRTRPLE